ncbi:hypothetical protein LZ32DRAFT_131906 [Colletotrichum eremochloae]|nr:hypothetical protein LZ32DRAFT_131906 [Colletotrichum eremochloae]
MKARKKKQYCSDPRSKSNSPGTIARRNTVEKIPRPIEPTLCFHGSVPKQSCLFRAALCR